MGATLVDATDKTLLPGLIDPHLHIGQNPKTKQNRPQTILRNGVTAARDPGRAIEDYRPVIATERPLPRVFLTGKHLDQRPHAHPQNALDITSAEQATRVIDRIVRAGGTGLKVYYRLPIDLISATCKRADFHQIPVTAHLELVRADAAILAGVDGLEHVTSCGTAIASEADAQLFEETVDQDNAARRLWRFRLWAGIDLDHPRVGRLIRMMASRGIYLTPTLNVFERRPGDKLETQPFHVDGLRNMLRFTRMCHDSGVPVVASSHGTPKTCEEGWAMHHEMQLLVEAGIPPLETITASTLAPAKFFRCDDQLGSIEVGKQADMVLYAGKPHVDIDDLWTVDRVMLAGRWVE